MTQQWVSFQEIKERVSIEDILRHYDLLSQLKSTQGGDELVGFCPFHPEKKESFRASRTKNAFNCFSPACGKHGNILDFVVYKEAITLREAALLIQSWFEDKSHTTPQLTDQHKKLPEADQPIFAPINPPLTFGLQNVQWRHEYLDSRKLKEEVLRQFGVGYYAGKGVFSQKIVIPVHDTDSNLVAYAARWPSDDVPEGEERYLLPRDFRKSHVLFNLHRAKELTRDEGLILVEGYFSVLRLTQEGYPNCVALMGATLSDQQREILLNFVGPQGRVTLMFDGDAAGRAAQTKCLEDLVSSVFVKTVELLDGVQPDHLNKQELHYILG